MVIDSPANEALPNMLVTGLDPAIIPDGNRDRRIETCPEFMRFDPL